MNNEELLEIKGGVSAAIVNAIIRAISSAYEIGRAVGSSIKRVKSGTTCKG